MKTPLGFIALAAVACAGPARAAETPAVDSSALKAMFDCRALPTKDARADCYDKAIDALQHAQAQGDVVVVDKEKLKTVRRQAFGFSLPSLSLLTKGLKEDPVKSLSVDLSDAHTDASGLWVMTTTEHAVWRQTQNSGYTVEVHAGSKLVIRPGVLGAFFCEVDNQAQFRCKREQ